MVLVCAVGDDEPRDMVWMANKLAGLRIFPDDAGRMNQPMGPDDAMLVVSQFTLAGDCRKGFRPSFVRAADPEVGRSHLEALIKQLREAHGVNVQTGWFGASMEVELVNDGPVTIWIDSRA